MKNIPISHHDKVEQLVMHMYEACEYNKYVSYFSKCCFVLSNNESVIINNLDIHLRARSDNYKTKCDVFFYDNMNLGERALFIYDFNDIEEIHVLQQDLEKEPFKEIKMRSIDKDGSILKVFKLFDN